MTTKNHAAPPVDPGAPENDPRKRTKYPWSVIQSIRKLHSEGVTPKRLAEMFGMSRFYVYSIVYGQARLTEDVGRHNAAVLALPKDYPTAQLKSPDGHLWKMRGRGPRRLKPVIPFATIVQLRMAYKNGHRVYDLSTAFGISPTYVYKLVRMKARVNG